MSSSKEQEMTMTDDPEDRLDHQQSDSEDEPMKNEQRKDGSVSPRNVQQSSATTARRGNKSPHHHTNKRIFSTAGWADQTEQQKAEKIKAWHAFRDRLGRTADELIRDPRAFLEEFDYFSRHGRSRLTDDWDRKSANKVAWEVLFEHVKFYTNSCTQPFQHGGSVMKQICQVLKLQKMDVDQVRWENMLKGVRKGLADRRTRVRSYLQTEVKAFYESKEYRAAMKAAPPCSEGWQGYTLVECVKNCFTEEASLPVHSGIATTKQSGESFDKASKFLKDHLYPLYRRWWLSIALRCSVAHKKWKAACDEGTPVSNIVCLSSEAFLLTTLENSAKQWHARFLEGVKSTDEDFPMTLYTGKVGGGKGCGWVKGWNQSGWVKGWNRKGIAAFNHNHDVVEDWRKNIVRVDLEKRIAEELRGDPDVIKAKKEAEKTLPVLLNITAHADAASKESIEAYLASRPDRDDGSFWL